MSLVLLQADGQLGLAVRGDRQRALSVEVALLANEQLMLSQGQAAGQVRSDLNTAIVRRAFFGALDEIAMQWVLTDHKYSLEESAREVAEIFIQGLSARNNNAERETQ